MLPTELTLHIGLQKTATTLIQRTLKGLRPQLAAQGVAYLDRLEMMNLPAVQGWQAFRDKDEPVPPLSPDMRGIVLHDAALRDQFTTELRSLAQARCEKAASVSGRPPRHLIISNEALVGAQAPDFGPIYRPRAEAALRHTFEALAPERVNLVLYVRRQDTLIESQYMERIRAGDFHDFADFAAGATAEEFIRFGELAARLESLELVATLRVRPFEVIGAGPERFVRDLLAPLALQIDMADVELPKANPSYTAPALESALVLNRLVDKPEQLVVVRQFLRKTFPIGRHPAPTLFGEHERRQVLNLYDRSNREFFARHVPGARTDAYASDEATASLSSLI